MAEVGAIIVLAVIVVVVGALLMELLIDYPVQFLGVLFILGVVLMIWGS